MVTMQGKSLNRQRPDYEAAVLVTDGESTKVAARVIFRGGDAYGIHPLEPRNAKVSFHKSGKRHVKLQGGKAQVEELMLPPEYVLDEEMLISFSLDNLRLPEYSEQEFDAVEIVDLRELPPGLPVVEISIGRRFYHEPGASEPDYREEVAVEKVLPREGEPKVCVRVSVISDPRQSEQPTEA